MRLSTKRLMRERIVRLACGSEKSPLLPQPLSTLAATTETRRGWGIGQPSSEWAFLEGVNHRNPVDGRTDCIGDLELHRAFEVDLEDREMRDRAIAVDDCDQSVS